MEYVLTTLHDEIMISKVAQDGQRVWTWVFTSGLIGAVALRLVGVPTIDLHGPLHRFGVMDPFCGGTRATFLLLSGDLGGAAKYNPVVFPLALVAVLVMLRAVLGWSRGIWVEVAVPAPARWPLFSVFLIGLIALGVRQQLNAALLMEPWGVA